MKIVWIYPKEEKCGIHIYSKAFVETLSKDNEVISIYTNEFVKDNKYVKSIINSADIVHIQFEISLFSNLSKSKAKKIFTSIKPPTFITLHEVYDKFPGVFPKDKISGNSLIKRLKEIKYDFLHPNVELLDYFYKNKFFSENIIVHNKYQINILSKKSISAQKIAMPFLLSGSKNKPLKDHKIKQIGCSGFMSPNYNWEFLFKVLKRLSFKWNFIWIGYIRRDEDEKLLSEINNLIDKYEFNDRFTITGWLSKEKLESEIEKLDIYTAFFRYKSTSSTIFHPIAKEIPTVATTSALTKEFYEDTNSILIASTIKDAVEQVSVLSKDKTLIKHLKHNMRKTKENYTIEKSAETLINLYGETLQ